jgi:hypothetical protein
VLIVDLVDGIGGDEARADDLFESLDNFIDREHELLISMQNAECKVQNAKWNAEARSSGGVPREI